MKKQLPALPSTARQQIAKLADAITAMATGGEATIDDALKAHEGVKAQQQLAKRYAMLLEDRNRLTTAHLLTQSMLGAAMPAGKPGRGNKTVHPVDGFAKATVAKFRKVAKASDKIEEYAASADEHGEEMSTAGFIHFVGSGGNRHTSGESAVEWYTPAEYIEPAAWVMDGIDLDPASSKLAQKTVGATTFYTEADDGLSRDWAGRVWLNPPYKMPLVKQFVEKLCEHHDAGDVSQAVLLVNNATDTEWFHRALQSAAVVCFTRGRISFYNAAGTHDSPTHGQAFFYFGKRAKRFANAFGAFGFCMEVGT